MLTTRAPLSTAQRIAFASASTEIVPPARDDLGDQELGGRREAGDAGAVVELGRDDPRDDRSVPARVLRRAADEALRRRDAPLEIGVAEIDARVDHGDAHRGERRRRRPGVVGAVGDVAYHWRGASGSVGANARRRDAHRLHPARRRRSPASRAAARASTTRAGRSEGARPGDRSPRSIARPTAPGRRRARRPRGSARRGRRWERERGGDCASAPTHGARRLTRRPGR